MIEIQIKIPLEPFVHDHCWQCSYDLRGLDDELYCPECHLPINKKNDLPPNSIVKKYQKGALATMLFGPSTVLGIFVYAISSVSPSLSEPSGLGMKVGASMYALGGLCSVISSLFLKLNMKSPHPVPRLGSALSGTMLAACGMIGAFPISRHWFHIDKDPQFSFYIVTLFILLFVTTGFLAAQASDIARRFAQRQLTLSLNKIARMAFLAFASYGLVAVFAMDNLYKFIPAGSMVIHGVNFTAWLLGVGSLVLLIIRSLQLYTVLGIAKKNNTISSPRIPSSSLGKQQRNISN